MVTTPGGSCRAVAPLLARANDPDLTEAEYVALSTHLLRCAACRARLDEYRALDRRVRTLPSITLDEGARRAVLGQVHALAAAAASAHRRPSLAWPGLATVAAATFAVMLLGSIGAFDFTATDEATPTTSAAPLPTSGSAFNRSLTAALLVAPPTQVVINNVSVSARATATATAQPARSRGAQPSSFLQDTRVQDASAGTEKEVVANAQEAGATLPAATGTVLAVATAERRLTVRLAGGATLDVVVDDEARILLPSGQRGGLRHLTPRTTVQLRLERAADGTVIATEVVVLP